MAVPGSGATPEPPRAERGWRVRAHLVQQELLLKIGSHSVPHGSSHWEVSESQVMLCAHQHPALQLTTIGAVVADGGSWLLPAQRDTSWRAVQRQVSPL